MLEPWVIPPTPGARAARACLRVMQIPAIQTSSERVKAVVRRGRDDVTSAFGHRCVAVYLMGSLARGGFSEAASDIDLGVVLQGPLEGADASSIESITSRARERDPALPNRLSVFWGSIESLNGSADGGRYPPYDRLDLIDCGLLLYGEDVRAVLVRPEPGELIVAGAAYALEQLGTEDRLTEFRDAERIADRGLVYLTKTVLFPARFIYLERTGKVASNDASASYYSAHFEGPDAELVARALSWRSTPLPPAPEILGLLERGLALLYLRFLDVYVPRLEALGETRFAARLARWRAQLVS